MRPQALWRASLITSRTPAQLPGRSAVRRPSWVQFLPRMALPEPQVGPAGIFDPLGGRQTFQVAETAFDGALPDAGAVSRYMEASLRLSYGCRHLRGEA